MQATEILENTLTTINNIKNEEFGKAEILGITISNKAYKKLVNHLGNEFEELYGYPIERVNAKYNAIVNMKFIVE